MTTRHDLFRHQKGLCHYCKKMMVKEPNKALSVTIEHLIPRSFGGTNDRYNLVGACMRCNNLRGNMSYAEFVARREELERTAPYSDYGATARLAFGARDVAELTHRRETVKMIMMSDAKCRQRLSRRPTELDPIEGASIGSLFPALAKALG